jgi:hypothetical protein
MVARREPVFHSFHYGNDALRVQQIRNIGMIEGNTPVSPSAWETVWRRGDKAIEKWIDENMSHRRCVIVLVGSETHTRPWVLYEIRKAWAEKRGLFGIYIHNIKCPRNGTCSQGSNPFSVIPTTSGQPLSTWLTCYDPGWDAYKTIAANMSSWVNSAIEAAKTRFG